MTNVKKGDRIRLVHMPNDPDPIPAGTEGTVLAVISLPFEEKEVQIMVNWDNGRSLSCVCPPDVVQVVSTQNTDSQ